MKTTRQAGAQYKKAYFIAGKPRRTCPLLTGWPGELQNVHEEMELKRRGRG